MVCVYSPMTSRTVLPEVLTHSVPVVARRVLLVAIAAVIVTAVTVTGGLRTTPVAATGSAAGWTVDRVGEADRYATAAKVSQRWVCPRSGWDR